MRLFALFSALFLFATTPVFAADINPAGADRLKAEVTDALRFYLDSAKTTQQGLRLSGDITVVPKKDFYEVRLPGVVLTSGNDRLEVGTIVVNATPGKDGEYLTAIAIPSPVTLKEAATGKAVSEFGFASQKFAGAWYPALGTFTKIDAEYKNVTVKDAVSKKEIGNASSLKTTLDLKKNADNTWSGAQKTRFGAITLSAPARLVPDAQNKVSIAHGKVDTVYDKIDLAQAKEMKDALRALYKDGAQPAAADIKKLFTDSSTQGGLVDGMKNAIEVSGISLSLPQRVPAGQPAETTVLKLDQLSGSFDVDGVRQDTGSSLVKAKLDNLSISGFSPEASGLVPSGITLNMTAKQLPIRDVSKIISGVLARSIDTAPANATPDQRAAAQIKNQQDVEAATDEIMALLAKTGANLSITDTHFDARDIDATLAADLKATTLPPGAETKAGFNGKMVLTVNGVDDLLAKYQEKAKSGDKTAERFTQGLSVLQMLGQQAKADGKSARTFTFDLSPDGRLKMNGADVSALSGLLQGMKGVKP